MANFTSGVPAGTASLANVQSEFGGSNPISLSEYYNSGVSVPASGQISINDLRGKYLYYGGGSFGMQTISLNDFNDKTAGYVTGYGFSTAHTTSHTWSLNTGGITNNQTGGLLYHYNSGGVNAVLIEGIYWAYESSSWTMYMKTFQYSSGSNGQTAMVGTQPYRHGIRVQLGSSTIFDHNFNINTTTEVVGDMANRRVYKIPWSTTYGTPGNGVTANIQLKSSGFPI